MFLYSAREWVSFFILYSILGWISESIFVSVKKHRLVNRGFLSGPFIPIYGFGALIMIISTIPVKKSYVLVFLFGMLGATLLEYITGYVLDKYFHVQFWNYSNSKFNINGYICLKCSLAWGVYSVLLVHLIHPLVEGFVKGLPYYLLSLIIFLSFICLLLELTDKLLSGRLSHP